MSVSAVACRAWLLWAYQAEDPQKPLLEQLPADRQTAVLLSLLGMVILGLGLIALIILAGRYTRRNRVEPTRWTSTTTPHEPWYSRPLSDSERLPLPGNPSDHHSNGKQSDHEPDNQGNDEGNDERHDG